MKIERIRKSHKKKIIIGVIIVLLVVSTITLTMSKSKYRLTQSMKLVTGTINYKVPDLRIVAVNLSEDGTNYDIVDNIPESGYTLNEEKSICKVATETSGIENAPKDNNVTIEYRDGLVNFRGITKRNTRCYLYFDKYVPPTSETTLAKLNINSSYIKSGNPDFTKVATGAETVADNGIYKASDPMYNGETYYWRGAATTNHVIFANKCWRIVRINGDGTIRLIYNGTPSGAAPNQTCPGNGSNAGSIAVTKQKYNASNNNTAYAGYTYTVSKQRPDSSETIEESNLKIQTDTWFENNIGNNEMYVAKVADGKYCNDRNVEPGDTWGSTLYSCTYAPYFRSGGKNIATAPPAPTLECDVQDVYTLKVGAIIMDEVMMAGGKWISNNSSYYLYNYNSYWTMSPSRTNGSTEVFAVNNNGNIDDWGTDYGYIGIRPVINLRSDVTFNAESDGTQNNPYIVQ